MFYVVSCNMIAGKMSGASLTIYSVIFASQKYLTCCLLFAFKIFAFELDRKVHNASQHELKLLFSHNFDDVIWKMISIGKNYNEYQPSNCAWWRFSARGLFWARGTRSVPRLLFLLHFRVSFAGSIRLPCWSTGWGHLAWCQIFQHCFVALGLQTFTIPGTSLVHAWQNVEGVPEHEATMHRPTFPKGMISSRCIVGSFSGTPSTFCQACTRDVPGVVYVFKPSDTKQCWNILHQARCLHPDLPGNPIDPPKLTRKRRRNSSLWTELVPLAQKKPLVLNPHHAQLEEWWTFPDSYIFKNDLCLREKWHVSSPFESIGEFILFAVIISSIVKKFILSICSWKIP